MNIYIKHYNNFQKAMGWAELKTRPSKRFVVVEGPENNWSVVDRGTAYEMNMPYWF